MLLEILQLKPWPKAAYIGIWMEISNYVDLDGAYFSQLGYDHKRYLSLDRKELLGGWIIITVSLESVK